MSEKQFEAQIAAIIDPAIDDLSLRNFDAGCACAICQRVARALAKADQIKALFGAKIHG